MPGSFEIVEQISEAGGTGNEDVAGVHIHGRRLDLWVIDGATSIAETEHLGLKVSDPAWFAQNIDAQLERSVAEEPDPGEALRDAIMTVRQDYETRIKGKAVPWGEKPLASLIGLRAINEGDRTELRIMAMGDCRVLVAQGNSSRVFPQQPRGDATPPAAGDRDGARNRNGVLLSHIEEEKKKRTQYHNNPTAGLVGFDPRAVDYARREIMRVPGAFDILGMSDGFYRLVDEYDLYSDESLWRAVSEKGLAALYKELRAHEQAAEKRGDPSVKRRDDATAIHVRFG